MIPIYKKGKDRNTLSSYRPMNNLNVIEKIIESILKKQIYEFIERHDIIHKNMHGSRKRHSIITAKIELDENINKHKDTGLKVALLSTDLSSACDTVEQKLLL